jgi:hypothetical protein
MTSRRALLAAFLATPAAVKLAPWVRPSPADVYCEWFMGIYAAELANVLQWQEAYIRARSWPVGPRDRERMRALYEVIDA